MASNFSATLSGRTMLFPCAAGVQIPQVGAEDAKVKIALGRSQASGILPMTIISQDKNPVNNRYVKMVSTGLTFSEDVVEDRCLHMMPYNEKYFDNIFETGELVTLPKRATSAIGRHNKRGTDVRHMPCYLKKVVKPQPLTPLRKQVKEKALQLHKEAVLSSRDSKRSKSASDSGAASPSSFFMTEVDSQDGMKSASPLKPILESKRESDLYSDKKASKSGEMLKSRVSAHEGGISEKGYAVTFKAEAESEPKAKGESGSSQESYTETKADKNDWDDHLMSRLSQLTANWIVHERMPSDKQKDKLKNALNSWYGPPTHTDLVREEISDGEEGDKKKSLKPKKKWKKKEASLLERVYNVTPPPVQALDPYSDDNQAPFYRQPAGIRRKKRNEEKETAVLGTSSDDTDKHCAINATAHNISMPVYVETPPPTLKDFLSPRVGDKIYDTDNLYQQEWLIGQKHVYKASNNSSEIHMDSGNKYQKQLQQKTPQDPEVWYTLNNKKEDKSIKSNAVAPIPEKGQKRWTGLPQPIDDTAGTMTEVSNGYDPLPLKTADPKQKRRVKQNTTLMAIVNDWRSKWFLGGQFADSTPDDLIRDMADIQPHVRLKAIGTVAKATEYKPPNDNAVLLESAENNDPVNDLPEQIFVALECLLDDSHLQVRKAAAITLYSMDRPSEKAQHRLRDMLESESSVDRWAACQCLAHYGDGDSDVVAEIIKQILTSEAAIKHEQGIHLLASISNSSTLVHCMVAEQLNSSSWRHRVIACKILPTLSGSINRDITQKLSELMWHDWHVEVRKAAAQCLGKTSHGRDVHDDIRDRIVNGSERTKMDALSKLGQLGIMTAKLLPAFLECFADPYVSVRSEVCITCGNLEIKEEQVLDRLVHLATFDTIWKVKALAMQALGRIGEVNDDIKECLLWAMRYEERPGVRAEACHSLVALDVQDDDVIDALQERLLVESSQIVRDEMNEALNKFGLSTSDDMDMVAQIKSEVHKLCTRNIIASQIIVNETDEAKRAQLKRMVCQTEKDIEALNERKEVILRRIRSQARSVESLGSTPQPRTSTPLPKVKIGSESTTPDPISREGTVFTPSADKELEAILNQEESTSESASGKSRPVTGGSNISGPEGENLGEKDETDGLKITIIHTEDEANDQEEKVLIESEGQFSAKQQLLSLPVHLAAQSPGLLSPSSDFKASRLSMGQYSDRRSIMSRDSLREREKVNQEMTAIYTDLNARYADMIQDLIKIDRGLNTKGSSADSSTDTSFHMMAAEHVQAAHAQIEKILSRNGSATVDGADSGIAIPEEAEKQNSDQRDAPVEKSDGNAVQQASSEENEAGDAQEVDDVADADVEWKSFADTLSKDGDEDNDGGSTSYPSFEEDVNGEQSRVSSAGLTGVASEYEENPDESYTEAEGNGLEM